MTKAYEVTKRYQDRQRAKGLCTTGCRRPLRTKYHCDECSKKSSYRNNKLRNKNRLELLNQGLCTNGCGRKLVLKWTCRECGDKINEYARRHWIKHHEHNKKLKLAHNHRYRFGGLRDKVIERDNHSCQICGYSKKVRVHHIDENNKHNSMENLITICIICHTVIERMNRTKPDLYRVFPWLRHL